MPCFIVLKTSFVLCPSDELLMSRRQPSSLALTTGNHIEITYDKNIIWRYPR